MLDFDKRLVAAIAALLASCTLQAAPVISVVDSKGYGLSARSSDYRHLDWVPLERNGSGQQGQLCGGSYIEPLRFGLDDQTPLSQAPIFITAERSFSDQLQQFTELEGDVRVNQAQLQLQSQQASFNHLTSEVHMQGNVRIRDRGLLMVGDGGQMLLDSGQMRLDEAEYVMHASMLRGNARYIVRNEEGVIRLNSGIYTGCTPGSNAWHIRGSNIVLDPNTGMGSATNATLRVKNVPILYVPYFRFPIDDRRQSGFLNPSFSHQFGKGSELSTPYYINLAPNYDATIYPTYNHVHGLHSELEFRYLSKNSTGMLGGAWLSGDRDRTRQLQSHYEEDRWLYHWDHQYGFNRRLQAQVDYTAISDPYYFQDFSSNLIGDQDTDRHLDQKASVRWRGDNFTAEAGVHAYELTSVSYLTPYERLPYFNLSGTVPGEPGGLRFGYQAQWSHFDRDLNRSPFYNVDGDTEIRRDARQDGLNAVTGSRLHLEPSISLPLRSSWGFLEPKVKYSYTSYQLDLDQVQSDRSLLNKSPSRQVPIYSIDGGLYFDRPTTLFGKNYTQTLEPRLFYLYVPYRDQRDIPLFDSSESTFSYASLFRDNRFSGQDRIGDANQLSASLTYRWLEEDGFERQRVAIGQTHYFQSRKVTMNPRNVRDPLQAGSEYHYRSQHNNVRKRSPLAGQYLYRFGRDWSLTGDMTWDPDIKKTSSGSLMLHYQPEDDPRKILNLGYRYRDDGVYYDENTGRWEVRQGRDGSGNLVDNPDKIVQTDLSFMWPVHQRWAVLGRWQYDRHLGRTLDAFGGVEYSSCCWSVRIVQRYWLEHDEQYQVALNNVDADRGTFVQFVFRGLGGAGAGKLNTFLDEGIQGYQRREQNKPF